MDRKLTNIRKGLIVATLVILACIPMYAAWPGITLDLFDNWNTCTAGSDATAACAKSSGTPNTFTWTLAGTLASTLTVQTATPPDSSDTSTKALQFSSSASNHEYLDVALGGSAKTAISAGVFITTGNYTCSAADAGDSDLIHFIEFYSQSFGDEFRLSDECDGTGNHIHVIRLSPNANCTGTIQADCPYSVIVANSTSYWVTFKETSSNANGYLSVYTISGSTLTLLASVTCDTTMGCSTGPAFSGFGATDVWIGSSVNPSAAVSRTVRLWSEMVDFTNAIYPLLPGGFTVESAPPMVR
jgi:hypothetical protein